MTLAFRLDAVLLNIILEYLNLFFIQPTTFYIISRAPQSVQHPKNHLNVSFKHCQQPERFSTPFFLSLSISPKSPLFPHHKSQLQFNIYTTLLQIANKNATHNLPPPTRILIINNVHHSTPNPKSNAKYLSRGPELRLQTHLQGCGQRRCEAQAKARSYKSDGAGVRVFCGGSRVASGLISMAFLMELGISHERRGLGMALG